MGAWSWAQGEAGKEQRMLQETRGLLPERAKDLDAGD